MKARDVMTSPVITIKRTASVREAAKLFLERHAGRGRPGEVGRHGNRR